MKMTMSRSIILMLSLMICSGSVGALQFSSARALLNAAPAGIPQGCVSPGLALETDCAPEISAANVYFGNTGKKSTTSPSGLKFDSAGIVAYLQTATPPSNKCCKASCDFNNNYCSCYPALLDIIKGFTANDLGIYYSTAGFIATRCNYGQAFYDTTCPANLKTALHTPNKC